MTIAQRSDYSRYTFRNRVRPMSSHATPPRHVPVFMRVLPVILSALLAHAHASDEKPTKALTMQQVLEASKASDWRPLKPENTLYMELAAGRVVIELAPEFAPEHAENLRKLAREKYFDGLAILRVQDNFVTQWGDPNAEASDQARSLGSAKRKLPAEFTRRAKGLTFTVLSDADGYASEVGFVDGFPAARDAKRGEAWLAHCYGMVGAGRDNDPESGSGAELYVVIGHAPRQLDRNIATVGRVVKGMEYLAALPRGGGAMGFYENKEQHIPIQSVRLASEVPVEQRSQLERLRTDTATFEALIESRRNRRDDWYLEPAGHIDLCSVPLPVRERSEAD
jgi:peptidylprolyl isomerase